MAKNTLLKLQQKAPHALERAMTVVIAAETDLLRGRIRSLLEKDEKESSEAYRYEISTARDRDSIFELVENSHPDLVIIECGTKLFNGTEFCREIRKIDSERHTGVIFAGEKKYGTDLAVECLEAGGDDYVIKSAPGREWIARVHAVLRLKRMTDQLRSANHRLKILSQTDELTGLANMRSFEKRFALAMRECREGASGLGVLMMDLDHFKSINDATNHLVGSYVIGEVGKMILQSGIFGPKDCAARYGGDEYIMFLRCDSEAILVDRAGEILEMVRAARFIKEGARISVTASIGGAFVLPGYGGKDEDLLKAADLICYRSKRMGRDQSQVVTIAGQDSVRQIASIEQENSEKNIDLTRMTAS